MHAKWRQDVVTSRKNNNFTLILTVAVVGMCCKKLYTLSFLYPILSGSLWFLANRHKLPRWRFAAEQGYCSWRDLWRQMGDLQMLEEQGAELAAARLAEICIYRRLLVFIKVGAMVSPFCCQSELWVSCERQCHNAVRFDSEQHSKVTVVAPISIAVNCQLFDYVDFANTFTWIFISCHHFPLQSFSLSVSEMSQSHRVCVVMGAVVRGCQEVADTNSATEQFPNHTLLIWPRLCPHKQLLALTRLLLLFANPWSGLMDNNVDHCSAVTKRKAIPTQIS